jgi:AraC family transcriptional regulator, transcriptional activator of pobA
MPEMNRRTVPLIGMHSYGEQRLRDEGFVAISLLESFAHDPQRLRPHYHDFFQMSLLLGKTRLMHDFRETEVSGATLFFLSPGQVHTIDPSPDIRGTIVSFTREFIDPAGGQSSGFLSDLPFFFATDSPPWLRLTTKNTGWVEEVFRQLQEEFSQNQQGAGEIFRSLLRILFVRAARWHSQESPVTRGNKATVLVRRFQQEVERHHAEWRTLDPYAKELGVSVNHLNDVVREETGQAAGEHIRLRRLLDAKRLLLHSTLSVSEIGYRLGFEDPSYFSRFFRRYEDSTPAGFRKQIREKYQKGEG